MRKVFVLLLVGLIALFVFSSISIVSAETACERYQIKPTAVNCQDCCDEICAILGYLPGKCHDWCYAYCDAGIIPCADGIIPVGHGQCSPNKPKYCENSKLIDKCQVCGCPSGKDCCSAGTPGGKGKCFTPEDQEAGCCEYGSGKCFDGTMDPALCKVCSQGKWHKGWWCEEGECVPEASTLVLLSTGLLFLAGYLRLRRKEN